jgi:hypothetical protein
MKKKRSHNHCSAFRNGDDTFTAVSLLLKRLRSINATLPMRSRNDM